LGGDDHPAASAVVAGQTREGQRRRSPRGYCAHLDVSKRATDLFERTVPAPVGEEAEVPDTHQPLAGCAVDCAVLLLIAMGLMLLMTFVLLPAVLGGAPSGTQRDAG
jgi:hypothetical protein